MIPVLGEKSLSAAVRRMLDLILLGGAGVFLSLPVSVRWYFDKVLGPSRENYYFLLVLMYITGFLALCVVYEMRKIFKTLNKKSPFVIDNVKSLNRIAYACFVISAAYIVKILFFSSFLTVVISMVFIIAGLFSMVLAGVFRQAVEVKEENDMTI